MKISLIDKPDNLINTLYIACKTCTSNLGSNVLFENIQKYSEESKLSLICKVIDSGHTSILEHSQFSFAIDEISRACSHQLVRHRHASFSQKSQRYVKEKDFRAVMPESFKLNEKANKIFSNTIKLLQDNYKELLDNNILPEDARCILPNACETSMVLSLNLRELILLANLRLCKRAQIEIRTLVENLCSLVIVEYPFMKKYLVPKCIKEGRCTEIKSCGYFKNKK